MEALDKETKAANLKHYESTINHPKEGEPLVLVRVVVPPGLWWGPSPNTQKLYAEGETLMVPESVFKNSDFHTTRKSVNGMIIRGVLERADIQKPDANKIHNDDLKAVLERNRELERQIAAFTGSAPPVPLVVPDESAKRGPGRPKKSEEI